MNKKMDPRYVTTGIKYTGSKLLIIPYIIDVISSLSDVKTVLDGFSGTTRVSQALINFGYDVSVNDISIYSKTFANCFFKANKPDSFYQTYLDELNSLEGKEGWFYKNYGEKKLSKSPFQKFNLLKLDAIREKIDEYDLEEVDKDVLLTSLVLSLDKVDSTIGHFASYLKKWSYRSYKQIKLELPKLYRCPEKVNIYSGDIFDCLKDKRFDLAYFDPPYGSGNTKMPPSRVRYNCYYHFWKTVILNDKPKLFGAAARREDSRDTISYSPFEDYRKDENGEYIATKAIKRLVKETNAKYLLFSYNNNGRVAIQELLDIFNEYGEVIKVVEIDYKKNIMSTMKTTSKWENSEKKNFEYLFLIKKF